jgi:hypothetical protein
MLHVRDRLSARMRWLPAKHDESVLTQFTKAWKHVVNLAKIPLQFVASLPFRSAPPPKDETRTWP